MQAYIHIFVRENDKRKNNIVSGSPNRRLKKLEPVNDHNTAPSCTLPNLRNEPRLYP